MFAKGAKVAEREREKEGAAEEAVKGAAKETETKVATSLEKQRAAGKAKQCVSSREEGRREKREGDGAGRKAKGSTQKHI